jgi:membrane-bound ClpP family serine protease
MLSFLVAVAYWPMKGVGVAGLVGTILVILGALGLLKSFRMFIGSPKKKRERSSYY